MSITSFLLPVEGPFRRELAVVELLVVLYALCYQLQSPLEPFLVDRLTKSEDSADAGASYAKLQSFFSFVQLFGSLAVGGLIDRFGIRFAFSLNFASCAASYGLVATATSMEGLYLSKAPSVFMAGFLCAQTAVAKLTSPGHERVRQLGRLTMAYTIGGTVGPALGGYLGTQASARFAVVGSVLAAALVMMLPARVDFVDEADGSVEDKASGERKKIQDAKSDKSWLARTVHVVGLVWPLLFTKIVSGFMNNVSGSVRPLILKNAFGMSEQELGLVMSTLFFSTAVVSMGLGKFTEFLGSECAVVLTCLGGMGASFTVVALAFAPIAEAATLSASAENLVTLRGVGGRRTYIALSLGLALFQFPLATTLTASSTTLVPGALKGTLVGVEHSLFALAGMAGPAAGVALLNNFGLSGLSGCAASVFAGLFFFWQIREPGSRGDAPSKGLKSS